MGLNMELARLNLTESHQDDVIVMQGDAERIRKELLKDGDGLAGEVRALTAAVRDLWNLLRVRLH